MFTAQITLKHRSPGRADGLRWARLHSLGRAAAAPPGDPTTAPHKYSRDVLGIFVFHEDEDESLLGCSWKDEREVNLL